MAGHHESWGGSGRTRWFLPGVLLKCYKSELLVGKNSVLEAKNWWDDSDDRQSALNRMSKAGIYGAVFGHQPKALGVKRKIGSINGGRFIKVDTGMAPEAGSNDGQLLEFTFPEDLIAEKPARISALDHTGKKHAVQDGS